MHNNKLNAQQGVPHPPLWLPEYDNSGQEMRRRRFKSRGGSTFLGTIPLTTLPLFLTG